MSHEPALSLRPAAPGDVRRLFEWRNLDSVWVHGSGQRKVEWDEHTRWFADSLASDDRIVFVVEIDGAGAGQLRFDRLDRDTAAISLYLLEQHRGRGRGVEAIRQGAARAFEAWPVEKIVACVRTGNEPSRAAFARSGFGEQAECVHCARGEVELSLRRDDAGATAS